MKKLFVIISVFLVSACASQGGSVSGMSQDQLMNQMMKDLYVYDLLRFGAKSAIDEDVSSPEQQQMSSCLLEKMDDKRLYAFLGPIYKKHYTVEDAKTHIKYKNTPEGQAFWDMILYIATSGKMGKMQKVDQFDQAKFNEVIQKFDQKKYKAAAAEAKTHASDFGAQLAVECIDLN